MGSRRMQIALTRPSYGTCPEASIQHLPAGELIEERLLVQPALPVGSLNLDLWAPRVATGFDVDGMRDGWPGLFDDTGLFA